MSAAVRWADRAQGMPSNFRLIVNLAGRVEDDVRRELRRAAEIDHDVPVVLVVPGALAVPGDVELLRGHLVDVVSDDLTTGLAWARAVVEGVAW